MRPVRIAAQGADQLKASLRRAIAEGDPRRADDAVDFVAALIAVSFGLFAGLRILWLQDVRKHAQTDRAGVDARLDEG